MSKEILFLNPVFTHNIWGGTKLREEYGYDIQGDDIGECWGIAAHDNGDCTIKNGTYAGKTLATLWKEHREVFGGIDGQRFPLLVKIIDAKDDLSIQVHPDDAYAAEHENGSFGKMECWYILDCPENATLVIGHNAKTKEEFLKIIDEADEEKTKSSNNNITENNNSSEKNNKTQINETEKNKGYELLGITGCPTGIAHTYMAAESLEQMGKELGHPIKVETQGQSGVKNELTEEEIRNAKAIIIAADVKVDLSRFDGKRIIRAGVSDGIRKPKELIEKALNEENKIPIYHHEGNKREKVELDKPKGNIYNHLMNGVTHMLPFVVGGGILIAIAFLLDDYSINPSNFGMNTPVAAFFKTVGGMAFDFMLVILSGYIAMSIADRPGLVVGFVGGALSKVGTTFTSLGNPEEVLVSSGFLGALLAGFIGGYVVLFLKKLFSFMPKSLEGIRTILIYPVAGVLLIGLIMLLINPFVSAINTGLNNFLSSMSEVNKVILGAILAGMMSVDLGGPVNKAAYTFGTGMLAEGHYEIMAAVMIGGMVAPLAIALLATFFPKKLPKKERQAGLLNYVMGLSFISEGAIPFASADPIRVLPACIVGSAVSGALSMAFNCTLMAPHGGIFVLPLIGNWFWYVVALAIGSVIAMGIMAALKKNIWEK